MSGPLSNCVRSTQFWDKMSVVASVAATLTDAIARSASSFLERNSHSRSPQRETRFDTMNCEYIAELLELTAKTHSSNPNRRSIWYLRDDRWRDFPESINRYVPEEVANISEWCLRLAVSFRKFIELEGCFDRCEAEDQQAIKELRELLTAITEISLFGHRLRPLQET